MPRRLFLSRYSRQNILCLTDADSRQHPDAVIRGLALWEDELDAVLGEGEGHDGDGAGPHYEALRPQPHEPDEGAQRVQDVGVVPARLEAGHGIITLLCIHICHLHLADEKPELGVAVRPDH